MFLKMDGNIFEEDFVKLPLVSPSSSALQSISHKCAICDGCAYSKHFRVFSCRACASFFRRTISLKRKYTCLNSDECEINSGKNLRHICRFHRFQRCIQMGMNFDAIGDKEPDELRGYSDPLRSILLSQRSTFVNRYAYQLKACGGDHKRVKLGKDNPVFANMVTVMSEFPVLIEYLRGSGFDAYGLDGSEIIELGKSVFYSWIGYNSAINTLRNSGNKLNLSYFIDESFVKVDDDVVARFVTTQPGLQNYDLVARVTMQCCQVNIDSAIKFHKIRIDEFEQAILFHIFALKTAVRLFPRHLCLKEELNKLFNELKLHYLRNYDDLAIRMGNLILMLSELSHLSAFLSEYVTLLHLNGYNPILKKLKNEDQ